MGEMASRDEENCEAAKHLILIKRGHAQLLSLITNMHICTLPAIKLGKAVKTRPIQIVSPRFCTKNKKIYRLC